MIAILLVVAGIGAFALPHMAPRRQRRLWQPWIESGLLPVFVGSLVHIIWAPWLAERDQHIWDDLRSLLALALTAAGMLAGMQLRLAYLRSAGRVFLQRQTGRACGQGLAVMIPATIAIALGSAMRIPPSHIVVLIGLLGALAIATSQRIPLTGSRTGRHLDLVHHHVTPAGWWNLVALFAAGISLYIARLGEGTTVWTAVLLLGVPITLGLLMGRLAVDAKNRNEAYLFLLAMLTLGGGITLAIGGSPLLSGLLIGACFNNVTLGRAATLERVLEELEQPMLIATGFFVGLTLEYGAQDMTWWLMAALLLPGRWIYRRWISPTRSDLAKPLERTTATPGATGLLIIGAISLAPAASAVPQLAWPTLGACIALSIVHEFAEWRIWRQLWR